MSYPYAMTEFASEPLDAEGAHPTPFAVTVDRSFNLPPVLHMATFACFFAFLGIMLATFAGERMGLEIAICVVFVVMAFTVPAMWVRMGPAHASRPLGWDEFRRDGIATYTGVMHSHDAILQVLILPVLVLCWAVAIAIIVAIYV
jgi:hypothetical protein